MKRDANWAKEHKRYLVDPELIGWLWPWHYHQILRLLEKHDSKWVEKNRHRILPYVPLEKREWLHPDAAETELLV